MSPEIGALKFDYSAFYMVATRNGVDSGWIHRFENRMVSRSGLMTQISAVSGRDV